MQHADLDVDDDPVLAPVPGGKARPPGLYHLLRARRDLLGRFVGVDIPDAHAQQFGPRVSQLAADGIVGVEDASEEIRDPETVDRRLDDGVILVFVALALGDVSRHAFEGDQIAGAIEYRQVALFGPDDGTVFFPPAQFDGFAAGRVVFGRSFQHVAVVRVHQFPSQIGIGVMLLRRIAGDCRSRRTDIGKTARGRQIVTVDQVRRVFREAAEPLLALAQRGRHLIALGEVNIDAEQFGFAPRHLHHCVTRIDGDARAVLAQQRQLRGRNRLTGRGHLRNGLFHAVAHFSGNDQVEQASPDRFLRTVAVELLGGMIPVPCRAVHGIALDRDVRDVLQ